jgi:hypothetical protein
MLTMAFEVPEGPNVPEADDQRRYSILRNEGGTNPERTSGQVANGELKVEAVRLLE